MRRSAAAPEVRLLVGMPDCYATQRGAEMGSRNQSVGAASSSEQGGTRYAVGRVGMRVWCGGVGRAAEEDEIGRFEP
jgi:hypothetical protein